MESLTTGPELENAIMRRACPLYVADCSANNTFAEQQGER
jgi:hypothetical protein